MTQSEVVKHFAGCREAALFFDQSALSRHLSVKGRGNDQEKLTSNPNALSAKRVRIVVRPDVDKAKLCEDLEKVCLFNDDGPMPAGGGSSLELVGHLRKLRGYYRRIQQQSLQQVPLDFFQRV